MGTPAPATQIGVGDRGIGEGTNAESGLGSAFAIDADAVARRGMSAAGESRRCIPAHPSADRPKPARTHAASGYSASTT
jgi:hypothetical protein